jgi:hypothetical protein
LAADGWCRPPINGSTAPARPSPSRPRRSTKQPPAPADIEWLPRSNRGKSRAPNRRALSSGRPESLVLTLPLVDALAAGRAGQAFKLELTAYEGETQIDSSSIDVQILSDPQEQQNPLPNREFLASLAKATGGREFTDAKALADALAQLPVAVSPPTIRQTPLWNSWMILYGLLVILGMEWISRRWLGLA